MSKARFVWLLIQVLIVGLVITYPTLVLYQQLGSILYSTLFGMAATIAIFAGIVWRIHKS